MTALPEAFPCGPLKIELQADSPALRDAIAKTLLLHDVPWSDPHSISVSVRYATTPEEPAVGNYLVCGQMRADTTPTGLRATCESGAHAEYDRERGAWRISLPKPIPEDTEHLTLLIATTGWRQLGWVPLHAGGVLYGEHCALVCAPSGGGKSTLLAGLIRRGAETLGDDKLLIRIDDGGPRARALVHNMNLHPQTRSWFPEVGDLSLLPRYSAWTQKRKVAIRDYWPDAPRSEALPSHLISLQRGDAGTSLTLRPLSFDETLSVLLRQTVFPRDRELARSILDTVAQTARALHGFEAMLPEGAYDDPECLKTLEALFR